MPVDQFPHQPLMIIFFKHPPNHTGTRQGGQRKVQSTGQAEWLATFPAPVP
jgi:hypothetical protein